MTVTIFIGSLSGGGAERVTCELANFLCGKGHTVEILVVSTPLRTYPLDPRIRVKTLLGAGKGKSKIMTRIGKLVALFRWCRQHQGDVLLSMLSEGSFLLCAMHSWIKEPMVAAERADPGCYSQLYQMLNRQIPKYMSGMVFQLPKGYRWYRRYLGKCDYRIIPNAVNPHILRTGGGEHRQKCIVSAGRLIDCKNFSLLLQAFSLLATDFPEYRLTIYGEGPLRQRLIQECVHLGINGKVCLPGFVDDLPDQLRVAEVFVCSSDHEGMSNVLIEAMALGLPCVSTKWTDVDYLIEDHVNGILVPLGDEGAMAEGIREILSNKTYAKSLSEQAAKVSERLSAEKIYGDWESFLLKVIEQKQKNRR